jgi:ComF family protein
VKALADLFFPPRCVGCARRGSWLCSPCRGGFPRIGLPRCHLCAAPTGGATTCSNCWRDPPGFDSLVAEFRFDGSVRAAIHQLKYRHARHLAGPLVEALLETGATLPPVELIVPVPLHPTRLRQRGFNQAGLLADELSRRIDREVVGDCLVRTKLTDAQMSLPAAQRWANVRDAFDLRAGASFIGQRILLVDDVATTTSTLRAAARCLRRGGAAEVHAIVIARAVAERPGASPVAS